LPFNIQYWPWQYRVKAKLGEKEGRGVGWGQGRWPGRGRETGREREGKERGEEGRGEAILQGRIGKVTVG